MVLIIGKNHLQFFLEILDYQESDATNKIESFSHQQSLTIVVFSIDFLMVDVKVVVAWE